MTWNTETDRSLLGFARAIRTYPGFLARLAAAACFLAVMAARSGVEAAGVAVAVALGIGVVIGYPIWRKTGTRR
jgi:hypothetical protein